MACSRLGLRETFGCRSAVGALPEDGHVAVTIGLKRDALTIRGPDGIAISSAERELPRRARSRQIVDPDVRIFPVIGVIGDLLSVRRDARRIVRTGRKSERLGVSLPIEKNEALLRHRIGRRTRDINERTGIRHCGLRQTRRGRATTSQNSFDNGNRSAGHLQVFRIERNRKQHAGALSQPSRVGRGVRGRTPPVTTTPVASVNNTASPPGSRRGA